jgi:hypothetical protein
MQERPRIALLITLGVAMLAMAPERVGPYRLVATSAGIEVHAPDDRRAGTMLVAAGLTLAAIGAWRARKSPSDRRNFALARVALGLGLAGVGGFSMFGGGTVWTASRDGIVERGRDGSETRIARAQIEVVAITRQRPDGAGLKNPGGSRPWTVQAGGAHFALASQQDAQRLAEELARAIGVEVRGP